MMQTLRKMVRYVLFVVLVGFLALIFFEWGGRRSARRDQEKTDIAEINGIPISYRDYVNFVQMKEQEQPSISNDEVWNLLIEEVMWGNLIQKERIRVTDEEIWAIIQSNPPQAILESEYMKNEQGEFDYNRYLELLRSPQSRQWLMQYEYELKRQVPREKLRSLLATLGWVSPFEDSVLIAAQTTVYDITYLQMPLFRARSLLVLGDDDLRECFEANPEMFVTKEMKILKYVFFEKKPSSYDTLEAHEQLEDFVDRIEEGEDFLELAQEVSDDTSIVISFEGPVGLKPYLMNVYKGLKNGEVSDIIQAPHGFEVIKRIETGLIYKVKLDIRVSESTKGEIYDKIMSFKDAAQELGFDRAAEEYEYMVHRTYPMTAENVNFPVRNPEGLADFIVHVQKEEIGGPFGSLGGYYLFALDSVIPESTPTFEEAKPRIKVVLERERLRGVIEEKMDALHTRIVAGTTIEDIASEDTMVVVRTIKDAQLVQLVNGMGGEFAGVAARLDAGDISVPLVTDWAGYIIRCDNKQVAPFDSSMIVSLQMKRQTRLQGLTIELFTPGEIDDYRDDFFE
jgi:parvulin-like peptidyl-prolyl isomerase